MDTGKYDFQLDMDTDNSNSVILREIKPNSKVLEIGCAHGRMTKYLKEQLNCEITIVEIDKEAGDVASQWAEDKYFLGDEWGNIESITNIQFMNLHNKENMDYIILADVLEHLHDPKFVLNNIKRFLKADGSIWISIPNVSHNSVLIDLWNDKFEYRKTGLLDNTHLKFFTESSLRKMVTDCGLKVVKEHNLINVVSNTEFNNSYDDVPPIVSFLMKRRPNGEVYQFVWELKL